MQQEKALAILKSGKNTFLTGSAGTGKTFVLNKYINYLKERKIPVAITASTGIAATHMNGMTIHSWAGIGVKDHISHANLVTMKTKKYLKEHLEKVKVLIIDEISMLHKNQLNAVNDVLQFFKENNDPFGGIQVVFSGDFFQLPPIGKREEGSKDKFSFMSAAWLSANLAVCYLTEQYRQEDNDLNLILNEIRTGSISEKSYTTLLATSNNKLGKNEELTRLFTHNFDVDKINSEHLETLKEISKKFKAKTKGNKKLLESLKKSVLAGENLELKKGAKVMFVRNNVEKGYVNGSMGEILNFNDDGYPVVKLHNNKIISVEKEDWTIQDDNAKVLASYNQIPLRLAWAITIHKCQGMTLDSALIDLSKTFEKGQGYVALSRLKNLEDLQLIGLNEMALKVDALALKADKRFQELSHEVDKDLSVSELDAVAPLFVKKCDGLNNPEEIFKNKRKIKEKKAGKKSTYAFTLEYLKKDMSLLAIAKERGLTKNTICGHLIKIRKDHPEVDLDRFKPSEDIIKMVRKMYVLQPKGSPKSTKVIYDGLKGKVSYDDINLAIAFL